MIPQRSSRPARARGLKLDNRRFLGQDPAVAPRAGAWIETYERSIERSTASVAPRAGAWIETLKAAHSVPHSHVAPRAGAWIETYSRCSLRRSVLSRPARARGLKPIPAVYDLIFACRAPRGRVD